MHRIELLQSEIRNAQSDHAHERVLQSNEILPQNGKEFHIWTSTISFLFGLIDTDLISPRDMAFIQFVLSKNISGA